MKQMTIFSGILLVLTIALCFGSTYMIHGVLDEMDRMHGHVLDCSDRGDAQGAIDALAGMARQWSDADRWMEMLADHEDIHSVREQIVSAKALLENEDIAQYRQCMALVREGLDHIRRSETLSLSNLF